MNDNTLLVVDSDDARKKHIRGLLEFLECNVVMAPEGEGWCTAADPESLMAVVLGPCEGPDAQQKISDELASCPSHPPVIVVAAPESRAAWEARRAPGLFLTLVETPVRYPNLAQALEQVRA